MENKEYVTELRDDSMIMHAATKDKKCGMKVTKQHSLLTHLELSNEDEADSNSAKCLSYGVNGYKIH